MSITLKKKGLKWELDINNDVVLQAQYSCVRFKWELTILHSNIVLSQKTSEMLIQQAFQALFEKLDEITTNNLR